MRRPRLVLLLLGLVATALVAAYLYGTYVACPPPDWWFRLFLRSGDFACVS